jgi:hypothetical protein
VKTTISDNSIISLKIFQNQSQPLENISGMFRPTLLTLAFQRREASKEWGTLRDIRIRGNPCLRQVREHDGNRQGSEEKAQEANGKTKIVKSVGLTPVRTELA